MSDAFRDRKVHCVFHDMYDQTRDTFVVTRFSSQFFSLEATIFFSDIPWEIENYFTFMHRVSCTSKKQIIPLSYKSAFHPGHFFLVKIEFIVSSKHT